METDKGILYKLKGMIVNNELFQNYFSLRLITYAEFGRSLTKNNNVT